jgi:hypothetical protein
VLVWTLSAAGLEPPPAEGLERLALAARSSIRTLMASIVSVKRYEGDEVTLRIKLWRDGEKGRADVVRSDGLRAGTRVVECRNCERRGYGVEYVESLGLVSKRFKMRDGEPPYLASAADWRVIGYYPNVWGIAQTEPLDTAVGSTDRGPVQVNRRSLGAADCWVLSFTSKRHGNIECWIDPARGHNVVRMRQSMPVDNHDFYFQIESDVRAVPGSQLWFPAEVRVTNGSRSKGASRLVERTEFTDVRINEAIPPETFTLAGFGVKEGAVFRGPDRPGQGREWRNGKLAPLTGLVPAATAGPIAPPVPVDAASQRAVNPWLAGICVLSALAALAVVVARRRG